MQCIDYVWGWFRYYGARLTVGRFLIVNIELRVFSTFAINRLTNTSVCIYSATSIIWTSFIRNLDYPDLLQTSKYISTHVQRVWPMILEGCGNSWAMSLTVLQSCLGQNWLTSIFVWMLLTVIMLCRGVATAQASQAMAWPIFRLKWVCLKLNGCVWMLSRQ